MEVIPIRVDSKTVISNLITFDVFNMYANTWGTVTRKGRAICKYANIFIFINYVKNVLNMFISYFSTIRGGSNENLIFSDILYHFRKTRNAIPFGKFNVV